MGNILDRGQGQSHCDGHFTWKNVTEVRKPAVQIFQKMENKCKGPEVTSTYGIQETTGRLGHWNRMRSVSDGARDTGAW